MKPWSRSNREAVDFEGLSSQRPLKEKREQASLLRARLDRLDDVLPSLWASDSDENWIAARSAVSRPVVDIQGPRSGCPASRSRVAKTPAVRARLEEQGGLPKVVLREFEEYLRCGILEEGCLHLACRKRGYSQVVAFSCRRRGFCPGCLGKTHGRHRVHLGQCVLPAVPIRHSAPCPGDCARCLAMTESSLPRSRARS